MGCVSRICEFRPCLFEHLFRCWEHSVWKYNGYGKIACCQRFYLSICPTRQDLTQGFCYWWDSGEEEVGNEQNLVPCWTILDFGLLCAMWTMPTFAMSSGTKPCGSLIHQTQWSSSKWIYAFHWYSTLYEYQVGQPSLCTLEASS